MESTSKGWMLIAAILGGLFLIVLLLALLVSRLAPPAYSMWYAWASQSRRLVLAPVGPFHVPRGYVLEGGALATTLDLNAKPYRMASVDGHEPDVLELAAFQNRDVSFSEAWDALRLTSCDSYQYAPARQLRVGSHSYIVERLECVDQQMDRRVEFVSFPVPQGSETVVAWGPAFEWRESVVVELLGSLQR